MLVLITGAALAIGLVMLGASLAAAPPPTPGPDETPGSAAVPRVLNVILRDYAFDPTPLYLYPGETVVLNVVNGGMVEHELVLGDASVQRAWAMADALATPPAPFATPPPASVAPGTGGVRVLLASGAAATVRYVVPPDPGLQMVCHLPGHAEAGMVGEVVLSER